MINDREFLGLKFLIPFRGTIQPGNFKRFVVKVPSAVFISIKHPDNTDTVACPPEVRINRVSL